MQKKRSIKTLVLSRSFTDLDSAVDYASFLQRFSRYSYAVYPAETDYGRVVYHVYCIKPFNSCRF